MLKAGSIPGRLTVHTCSSHSEFTSCAIAKYETRRLPSAPLPCCNTFYDSCVRACVRARVCVCVCVCVNGLFGIVELCGCDSADESMKH